MCNTVNALDLQAAMQRTLGRRVLGLAREQEH